MKEKQYPVGLPVYHVLINNLSFIKKVEGVDGDSLILGGQKIKQKHVIPLTEAEYFTEVMQPKGWVQYSNGAYSLGYKDPENGRICIGYFFGVFIDKNDPTITRDLLKLQSEALDHYEALQAIRNFEKQKDVH